MTISFNFRRRAKPNVHLRIWNVTRETELAASVELANHSAARMKGLLGRDSLFAGEGLWILPCQAVHTVGMRFPIDLVYLDHDLRVRKVRSNVFPWRLSACVSAHSVLELAPGTIQETQTNSTQNLLSCCASGVIDRKLRAGAARQSHQGPNCFVPAGFPDQ